MSRIQQLAAEAMFSFEGQELPITYTVAMTHDGVKVEDLGHSFLRIDAVSELVFPGMGTIPGVITFGYLPEIDLLVRLDSKQEIPGNNGLKTLESLSLSGEDGAGVEVPQIGCNQQGWLTLPQTMVPA